MLYASAVRFVRKLDASMSHREIMVKDRVELSGQRLMVVGHVFTVAKLVLFVSDELNRIKK